MLRVVLVNVVGHRNAYKIDSVHERCSAAHLGHLIACTNDGRPAV